MRHAFSRDDGTELGDDKAQMALGKPQLSGEVASQLREWIIFGRLKPGQFLRVEAMAQALRVSTTPVREGLLLLQSESFVRLMPRRGFQVNRFSSEDIQDLFWAQAALASELCARAAHVISAQELDGLRANQKAHAAAVVRQDEETATRLGHEFHRAINLSARSPRLAMLLGGLTKQLPNRFYASIEGQLHDALQYHPLLIEALRLRDAELARTLMHRHIASGADHLIQMLERQLAGDEALGPEGDF